jgi:hypothetical protein
VCARPASEGGATAKREDLIDEVAGPLACTPNFTQTPRHTAVGVHLCLCGFGVPKDCARDVVERANLAGVCGSGCTIAKIGGGTPLE